MDLFSTAERIILKELSADSRISVTELAKRAKTSRVTVMKILEVIEVKLDVRYILEIDETKLGGLERHLVVIKFLKRPSEETLSKFFKNDRYAQEVYATKGAFDIFIYARASDPASYIRWETAVAEELSEYRPLLRPSECTVAQFGFWPLDGGFVDDISASVKVNELDKRMLRLLNENSRMSISDLAKATGSGKGTVRYRLLRLKRSGIIKRFTIAVQKPPQEYAIMHFSNYRFNIGINDRMLRIRKLYMNADDGGIPTLTTFQNISPISGSFRSFGFELFYNEEDAIETIPETHKRVFAKDNIDIHYIRVTKVLKGLLPFRNLEIKANYLPISWTK